MPYGHASMLLLGEGSEVTEPYNKYYKIRLHSIGSLQFDQKIRPLSFRPEKFDLFTATRTVRHQRFGRQKFLPISATIMSPKCPVKYARIPLVPQMQERSEAERRAIWPCLNVATWRRERSDRAIQQIC